MTQIIYHVPIVKDQYGNSEIMFAMLQRRSLDAIRYIDRGDDLTIQNMYGEDALLVACRMTDEAVIDKLLSKGVYLENKDIAGKTPLLVCLALQSQEKHTILANLDIADKLIDFGANIHVLDHEKNNCIMYLTDICIYYNRWRDEEFNKNLFKKKNDLIKLLLDLEIEVDIHNIWLISYISKLVMCFEEIDHQLFEIILDRTNMNNFLNNYYIDEYYLLNKDKLHILYNDATFNHKLKINYHDQAEHARCNSCGILNLYLDDSFTINLNFQKILLFTNMGADASIPNRYGLAPIVQLMDRNIIDKKEHNDCIKILLEYGAYDENIINIFNYLRINENYHYIRGLKDSVNSLGRLSILNIYYQIEIAKFFSNGSITNIIIPQDYYNIIDSLSAIDLHTKYGQGQFKNYIFLINNIYKMILFLDLKDRCTLLDVGIFDGRNIDGILLGNLNNIDVNNIYISNQIGIHHLPRFEKIILEVRHYISSYKTEIDEYRSTLSKWPEGFLCKKLSASDPLKICPFKILYKDIIEYLLSFVISRNEIKFKKAFELENLKFYIDSLELNEYYTNFVGEINIVNNFMNYMYDL